MRLIDIDKLCEQIVKTGDIDFINKTTAIIKKLPTIDTYGTWIPCSERLPEAHETVLITHKRGVSVGWHNGIYWERGASTKHRKMQTVIAWMPLPQQYQEVEHDL